MWVRAKWLRGGGGGGGGELSRKGTYFSLWNFGFFEVYIFFF
eukprot:COSAG02_NODE_3937_length_6020_cov_16.468502_7_plen_41_part_01